ncbi:type II secretion system protein GspL [Granulosicoccus antarcticus]|uniref:Type II secretion system protein L n=1 Tax=Granulosicoccus antarcticus IMCC3135 TaxID=1192854 RepID=A0A2Z2P2T0_9GAMM|nr:type II secretion system protein GspL [Granulosicoccus antarcticus]ASJ76648.1 Type II secretion system protein L [Granulosicoccus antarcticus IMCC3135]
MSKHVIIYMPRVGEDSVQWTESDDSGRLTSGVKVSSLEEVAELVEGRRVTLILPADDVLLAEARVPGNSLARAQQAVPFALEEQVADDVDELHFALGAKGRDDVYPVAVISQQVMEAVTDQCQLVGLRPTVIVPETLALPQLEGSAPDIRAWTALLDGDQAVIRLDGNKGFATDSGMASIMLEGAREALDGDVSASLVIFRTENSGTLTVPEQIDVEVRPVEHRLALYASGLVTSPYINLLQGVYNPKKNFDKTWKPWRWTAGLAACLVLALFAGKWLDVRQLSSEEAILDAQIKQSFEEAMPGARMQRPQRQIQAALDRLSGSNTDGFTNRMAQIAASLATQPQTELKTIGYRSGRFDLDLNTDAVPTLDALKSELANRGSLGMTVQSANRENNSVRGRVRIE